MNLYKLDIHLRDARFLIEELWKEREENEKICAGLGQMVQELKAQCSEMQDELNRVRADAIREFAERLIRDALGILVRPNDVVTVEQIKRIAREMVGGNNA